MPRFYFDIRDQDGVTYDDVGLELPDLEAARAEARLALGELMVESISRSGTGAIRIEIRTEDGRPAVEVVAATDDRERSF